MNCDAIRERLVDFLYGELGEQERRVYEEHLAGCAACRREVEGLGGALGQARATLRAAVEADAPPARVRAAVLQAAAAAAAAAGANAPNQAGEAARAAVGKAAPPARKPPQASSEPRPGLLAWLRKPWFVPAFAAMSLAAVLVIASKVIITPERPSAAPASIVAPPPAAEQAEPAPPAPAVQLVGAPPADEPLPALPAKEAASDRRVARPRASAPVERKVVVAPRFAVPPPAESKKKEAVAEAEAEKDDGPYGLAGPAANRARTQRDEETQRRRAEATVDSLARLAGGEGGAARGAGVSGGVASAAPATAAERSYPKSRSDEPLAKGKAATLDGDLQAGAVAEESRAPGRAAAAPKPTGAPAAAPSAAQAPAPAPAAPPPPARTPPRAPARARPAPPPPAASAPEPEAEAAAAPEPAPAAAPAADESRADRPLSLDELVRRADRAFAARRWNEAEQRYAELLRRFPDASKAQFWRGRLRAVREALGR